MEDAVAERVTDLTRERLQLVLVLLEVLGVRVAHDATRLARIGAANRGAVVGQLEQRVLVALHALRFRRRDKARADPDAVGAEAQCSGEAASVVDAAGRYDNNAIANGVDDLRDERHRRNLAGVASRLGPLRDDDVATGLDGQDRVVDLAAHVHHQHAVLVTQLDDVAGYAEAGYEHAAALGDDLLDLRREVARRG